jgi:hypothetical protein
VLAAPAPAQVTTVVGGGAGDGGPALQAVVQPRDVVGDAAGNLWIADVGRIRRYDAATGAITSVAGIGVVNQPFGDGGPATQAGFGAVSAIARDGAPSASCLTAIVAVVEEASGRVDRLFSTR